MSSICPRSTNGPINSREILAHRCRPCFYRVIGVPDGERWWDWATFWPLADRVVGRAGAADAAPARPRPVAALRAEPPRNRTPIRNRPRCRTRPANRSPPPNRSRPRRRRRRSAARAVADRRTAASDPQRTPPVTRYVIMKPIIFQSVLSILKSTTEYLLSIFDYFEYHWIIFFIILRVSFDYLSSIFWLSFEYFSFIIQYLSIIFQLF